MNTFRPPHIDTDWQDLATPTHFFDRLPDLGQFEEITGSIAQESQARVALLGLPNAGKSHLFNHLRGWPISRYESAYSEPDSLQLESYGAFLLVRLPATTEGAGEELLFGLGNPDLLVYLINARQGVTAVDFRWVSCLRATGKPLVLALNQCDKIDNVPAAVADAEQKLGMPVIPISAQTGQNIEEQLLPAWLDAAPRLAVSLGREITSLRRHAARRIIRQAALFAGMISVQPIPLLDIPVQAMLQVGVVLRIGAAYGRPPSGGVNREMVGTVGLSMIATYLIQTALKYVPFIGWALNGVLGGLATLAIGELAIRYYATDWQAALTRSSRQLKQWQEKAAAVQPPRFWKKGAGRRQAAPQDTVEEIEIE